MQDKRYQVFISTSGVAMQPERIVLAQTLIGMGFFSWGLEQRTPLSTALARRQIDDCDYVILLLGSHYGDLSVSGVSYVHLEYIYAVTKQKPVIIFMHESPETRDLALQDNTLELREKFFEFRKQLQQEVEQIFYYRTLRELELSVRLNMSQIIERYPAQGWVRPQNTQALQDKIDGLQNKLHRLETELNLHENAPLSALPRVQAQDIYTFEYRVHAYQDGNFKELKLERKMTWIDILRVLSDVFKVGSSEEYFSKCINEYLNETGLTDARQFMPRAHAVARAQMNIRALHHIKIQMRQNDWIIPIGRDERQRMLWQLTTAAMKQLKIPNTT